MMASSEMMVGPLCSLVKEQPAMLDPSRRQFLDLVRSAPAGLALAMSALARAGAPPADLHQQLLDLAARQEEQRRKRFAAVSSQAELDALRAALRETFLALLDGFPERQGIPAVHRTGTIEADLYVIEKLVYESFPGYFVPALLYKPKNLASRLPGVLSPCGHSTNGKAAGSYQILHINLARRGYVVLTYDPVGQGERSQFWDAEHSRSRFDLSCGEHAVLGNPLYLLGTNLARYRIWDGIRGLDYLASLPEVDPARLGCVGNSGGGNLTAYIAALDPRVTVAAICCYITTLRRRMANRIQEDPSADPEQDIYGFVGEGIDHAGLLALRAPRPTLMGVARFDFFPIEGARESFAEAQRLYQLAGAGDRVEIAEAAERHGLTAPLRLAVYRFFDRWLAGRRGDAPVTETPAHARPDKELLVCAGGQVNRAFRSRPLLPLAWEAFDRQAKPPRIALRELLRLDFDQADPRVVELTAGRAQAQTTVVCINGNEARDWREETSFIKELERRGHAAVVVEPRGVGRSRPRLNSRGQRYSDPLSGVEENIAYNAFLVSKSLVGMRVTDVLVAIRSVAEKDRARRIILCGRRDAALVACLAAAVEPAVRLVACEELLFSFRQLFVAEGFAINAASIHPGLMQRFGDVTEILAQIAPRKVLLAAGVGEPIQARKGLEIIPERFSAQPDRLLDRLQNA
jgi:dienelactone hydrolase